MNRDADFSTSTELIEAISDATWVLRQLVRTSAVSNGQDSDDHDNDNDGPVEDAPAMKKKRSRLTKDKADERREAAGAEVDEDESVDEPGRSPSKPTRKPSRMTGKAAQGRGEEGGVRTRSRVTAPTKKDAKRTRDDPATPAGPSSRSSKRYACWPIHDGLHPDCFHPFQASRSLDGSLFLARSM